MERQEILGGDAWGGKVCARAGLKAGTRFKGRWEVRCLRNGAEIWRDVIENLVVDEGLNDYLDKYWKGAAYTAAHFIGLTGAAPVPAAGDTMAAHAGWAEVHAAYSQATRPAFVPGAVAGKSVSNTASKASFSITAVTTVGGAFATTDNTKGGAAGLLTAVGAFTVGDRVLQIGDTLEVTATFTSAAA